MARAHLTNKPIEICKLNAFPKVKCAFHPEEPLTNFCLATECLLPLCPKCVKLHTQEHSRIHSHGQFETLAECLRSVEKSYLDYISETKLLMKSVHHSA